jgi:hypothetical protein
VRVARHHAVCRGDISHSILAAAWRSASMTDRTYDWNESHSRFLNRTGRIELWTTSADKGFQVLQFRSALPRSRGGYAMWPAEFARFAQSEIDDCAKAVKAAVIKVQ